MRVIVAFLVLTAGCASSKQAEVARPEVVAAPAASGEIIVGALSKSELPKGECGMILWTLEVERPAPIFRLVVNKGAELVVNGEPVTLSVVSRSGASGFGVFEEQTLEGEGLKATVNARFGLGFDGGSYLERGLLTVESASGWRTVIPAAGVAGCRGK